MTLVRAAVVQAAPVAFDLKASLDKLERLAGEAADADIVVFPEAFLSAYPRGVTFGTTIGTRTEEGRRLFRRFAESAVDIPGPATDRLGAIAREHGQHLVIGVVERAGRTLYCTAVFIGPDGSVLGKHRKLMPTGAERLIWGCGDGSTLPVLDTPIGRIGAVICWENYMPLLRMHMYGQGVQLYCAPTADARDTWIASMRHVASEGRCFVLSANQFARRSDYPLDYPLDEPADAVLCRGGSVIVSPLGELLAGPAFDGEQILRAELDLGAIAEASFDLDIAGHYARADIFQLSVNQQERIPVIAGGSEGERSVATWQKETGS